MPQMAPINWMSLFIMFSATLIMFTVMNYYMLSTQAPKTMKKKELMINALNWKW